MSKTEFEKAMKEFADKRQKDIESDIVPTMSWRYNFDLGTDVAYEWCKEHRPYAAVCDMFAKQITEENLVFREKLALAVEALEKSMLFSGNADAVHGCRLIQKRCKQALEKINERK